MKTFIVTILVEEDKLIDRCKEAGMEIDEDTTTESMIEGEFGWLENSGIVLGTILDSRQIALLES